MTSGEAEKEKPGETDLGKVVEDLARKDAGIPDRGEMPVDSGMDAEDVEKRPPPEVIPPDDDEN